MDGLEDKELLHRFSVSIILVLMSYGVAFAGVGIERDTQKVSIEIPTPCHKVEKIDGNKIYFKSPDKPCIQVIGRTHIEVGKSITNVFAYIDDVFWKEQKVLPVQEKKSREQNSEQVYNFERFEPKPGEIERAKQMESRFKKPEYIEKAKQYEHLKDKADMDKVQAIVQPQSKTTDKQTAKTNLISKPDKQKYIFYLFSKSIPDIAVESVFKQSKKLDINFYGVLRGIDRDRFVFEKIKGIKGFEDITVKVNPLIFKAVGAQMVPAIVYAYCPPPAMFRSVDCEWKYVVYGDISLRGALEVMGRHDSEMQRLYEELLNAF